MKLLVLLFAAVALTACSSYDVSTDYNPATNFTTFRTFAVKKDLKIPGDVLQQNDFTRDRVYSAIESAMVRRGYHPTDEGTADLIVLAYAGVKDKVNMSTYGYSAGPYWGGGYYGGGYYGGGYSTQTVVTHYNEGTLHIDILDAKEKALVWKGQGTGVVEKSRSPKEREEMVNEAVGEILAEFPPM